MLYRKKREKYWLQVCSFAVCSVWDSLLRFCGDVFVSHFGWGRCSQYLLQKGLSGLSITRAQHILAPRGYPVQTWTNYWGWKPVFRLVVTRTVVSNWKRQCGSKTKKSDERPQREIPRNLGESIWTPQSSFHKLWQDGDFIKIVGHAWKGVQNSEQCHIMSFPWILLLVSMMSAIDPIFCGCYSILSFIRCVF